MKRLYAIGIGCAALLAAGLAGGQQTPGQSPREGQEGEVRGPNPEVREPGRGERRGEGRQWAPGQQRREFTPEQMRERMRQFATERVRERLHATDDEWAVLEPLINRVAELRRQARAGVGPMGGRGPRPAADEGESPVAKAMDALRAALQSDSTTPETLKARLEELRTAREQVQEELKKAVEELRGVLTLRQEAELVLMGLID